jgi:hypothetical protein
MGIKNFGFHDLYLSLALSIKSLALSIKDSPRLKFPECWTLRKKGGASIRPECHPVHVLLLGRSIDLETHRHVTFSDRGFKPGWIVDLSKFCVALGSRE